YLSCNPSQATAIGDKAGMLIDTFQGLGPMGGILSAFRKDPNGAWLTVACDLPLLTSSTLQYLIKHRNPSKLATAFFDSDAKFPEPLVDRKSVVWGETVGGGGWRRIWIE